MDFTSTCCCCIPIRKGVFVVVVLTLLEGIGDIVLVSVLNLLQCYEGGHPDGWNNNDDDGHHADNNGYHTDNYSYLIDNYGYHNDNGDSYNLYDVSMVTPTIEVSNGSSCHYFQVVGIWIIALCINSCFYTVFLLIGVKKMIPNLLVSVVILMGINGANYLALGIIAVLGSHALIPLVIGIRCSSN